MTLHYGPSIAKSGLVFAYDSANTQKSWKGKPTVNILTSGTGFDAAAERSGTSYPFAAADITSYILANWSASNDKISISFEGKRDYVAGGTGGGQDGYPVMYIYFTDWTWSAAVATAAYDWTYASVNNITMPNPAGKTIYFSVYHMNYSDRGLSYSRKHQIEFGEFATPFVNGTRSNTQAILDLTGNNTITASSLTYASDNTFSFNGTNNYIGIADNVNTRFPHNIPWTIQIATTIKSFTNSYPGLLIKGNSAASGVIVYFTNSGQVFFKHNNAQTQACSYIMNQPFMLTLTHNGTGTVNAYKDGVFTSQMASMVSTESSSDLVLGKGDEFGNSVIHSFFKYSRELSASEVAQNFAALRGRFGI